ncbi:MAG: hypothetical protein ACTSWY_00650, partial [Promethearchaeota archaeon]
MSQKIESFINKGADYSAVGIAIKWNLITYERSQQVEKSGLYNINTHFYTDLQKIENAKTEIESYYNIFNELVFSDSNNNNFSIMLNRITRAEIENHKGIFEFEFHGSCPQNAFDLPHPILSGSAILFGEEVNIVHLIDLIHSNLIIDKKLPIPRCEHCGGSMCIKGTIDIDDEIIDDDFFCMDCYNVVNNFFNLFSTEVEKITDKDEMEGKKDILLQYAETGKENAINLQERQLTLLYETLIIRIQYLSGQKDTNSSIHDLEKIQETSLHNNFKKVSDFSQN